MRFHTSLPVKSIPETVAFYRTLFMSEPVKTKGDYAKFLPETGGLNISFHQDPEKVEGTAALHLGFEMPDRAALDDAYARLKNRGFISDERETSICCYAQQDKFWVTDPNGYQWEIYLVLEDTEFNRVGPSQCCTPTDGATATGCC